MSEQEMTKADNRQRYIELGYNIAYYRKHAGLTQEQLAAKVQLAGCDLTRSALAKIECGQRSIYPDELKALHEALQVPYEALLQ